MGLEVWNKRIKEFGFGTKLGGHIPGTRAGAIPNSPYYDNIYGKNHWGFRTIFSIAIGEGELLTTPLQIANLAAIIANRGYFIEPHPIRDIGGRWKPLGLDSLNEISVCLIYTYDAADE